MTPSIATRPRRSQRTLAARGAVLVGVRRGEVRFGAERRRRAEAEEAGILALSPPVDELLRLIGK